MSEHLLLLSVLRRVLSVAVSLLAGLGGRIAGERQRLERANLFQDRDYPVLNDYRAVLGGLFRWLWALTPAQCAQIFPQTAPVGLKLIS